MVIVMMKSIYMMYVMWVTCM